MWLILHRDFFEQATPHYTPFFVISQTTTAGGYESTTSDYTTTDSYETTTEDYTSTTTVHPGPLRGNNGYNTGGNNRRHMRG